MCAYESIFGSFGATAAAGPTGVLLPFVTRIGPPTCVSRLQFSTTPSVSDPAPRFITCNISMTKKKMIKEREREREFLNTIKHERVRIDI